jgi:hypothetical protein
MMNDSRQLWVMIGLAALLACAGCSKPKFYPTRGKVIVYGVGPLKEGEIRIRPKKNHSLVATGEIKKDGTFSASTPGHGEGVLEGDCEVAIVFNSPSGKRPIAERYSDFSTSGLNFSIARPDENYLMFDVKKSGE